MLFGLTMLNFSACWLIMMTSPFQLVQFLAGPTLAMRSARSMGSLEATSMITASKNGGAKIIVENMDLMWDK